VNRFEEAVLLKKYSKFVKKVGNDYEISCRDKKITFLENVIADNVKKLFDKNPSYTKLKIYTLN
jgi:hypothetical protein